MLEPRIDAASTQRPAVGEQGCAFVERATPLEHGSEAREDIRETLALFPARCRVELPDEPLSTGIEVIASIRGRVRIRRIR
jgi:hypothetical protein